MNSKWLVELIILLTLLHPPLIFGLKSVECLDEVRAGKWGPSGGTDNYGRPISNITIAVGITYDLCVRACGTGFEPVAWTQFSQQFSSWLLPWLALISQLPYGANSWFENFVSVLLTVGSPTLAAYSLAFTVLNKHWICQLLGRYENHSSLAPAKSVAHVLTILQQYPLTVNTGDLLLSLIILPENKLWWDKLADKLYRTPVWSISAVVSMVWVAIAYLFTIIDSFTGILSVSVKASGQGIGCQWLWLMPIIIGWLQVSPECDSVLLRQAVDHANEIAHVSQDGKPVLASTVSDHRAIHIASETYDNVDHDRHCTIPIYNYARFLSWVEAVQSIHEIFKAAMEPSDGDAEGANPHTYDIPANSCSPPFKHGSFPRQRWSVDGDFLIRFFTASLLALILQWGTIGAATFLNWFTPTYGLGCRSGSAILYGILSTLAWQMFVTSSFLASYSTKMTFFGTAPRLASTIRNISIILRRLAKFTASANAIWLVVTSIFQFTGFFDNCWCDSNVLGLRGRAYDLIDLSHVDLTAMKIAWICGVALAGGSAIVFFLAMTFFQNFSFDIRRGSIYK